MDHRTPLLAQVRGGRVSRKVQAPEQVWQLIALVTCRSAISLTPQNPSRFPEQKLQLLTAALLALKQSKQAYTTQTEPYWVWACTH